MKSAPRPDGSEPGLVVACTHPERRLPDVDVARLVREVLRFEECRWSYIGIILSDHDTVHRLNRDYLRHDFRTDVLSFVIDESADGLEGEVYVDLDTAEENAARFGASFEQEVARYVIHGLLHLAGHDDSTETERNEMRRLEDSYLGLLGFGATPSFS